jgi:hypothetical protein
MRDLPLNRATRSTAMHRLRGHRHLSAIGVSISVATCPGWRRASHPQMGTMRGGSAPQLWFNLRATKNPDLGCRTSVADQMRRHANFYVLGRRFTFRVSPLTRCVLASRGRGIALGRCARASELWGTTS